MKSLNNPFWNLATTLNGLINPNLIYPGQVLKVNGLANTNLIYPSQTLNY